MNSIEKIKPAAAEYIERIDGFWKNTTWLQDENVYLPQRFGILTSNTSESVNSMLADARKLSWLDLTEAIVDIRF